jgi:hypothetical protein
MAFNYHTNMLYVHRRCTGFAPHIATLLTDILSPMQRDKEGVSLQIGPLTGHFSYRYTRQLDVIPIPKYGIPATASAAAAQAEKHKGAWQNRLKILCDRYQLPTLLPDYFKIDGQPQAVYAEHFGYQLLHYWVVRYVPQVYFGDRYVLNAAGDPCRERVTAALPDESVELHIGLYGGVVGIEYRHTPFEPQPDRKPVFRLAPKPTETHLNTTKNDQNENAPLAKNTTPNAAPTAAAPRYIDLQGNDIALFAPSLKARVIGDKVVPFYVCEDGREVCAVEGVAGEENQSDEANTIEDNHIVEDQNLCGLYIYGDNSKYIKQAIWDIISLIHPLNGGLILFFTELPQTNLLRVTYEEQPSVPSGFGVGYRLLQNLCNSEKAFLYQVTDSARVKDKTAKVSISLTKEMQHGIVHSSTTKRDFDDANVGVSLLQFKNSLDTAAKNGRAALQKLKDTLLKNKNEVDIHNGNWFWDFVSVPSLDSIATNN